MTAATLVYSTTASHRYHLATLVIPQAATSPGPQERGCGRCLTCSPTRRRHARRWSPDDPTAWPAGLESPTVYYHIRARQLRYQCSASDRQPPQTWRVVAVAAPSKLRSMRGLPQLQLLVPTACTNVQQGDSVVYLAEQLVNLKASKAAYGTAAKQQANAPALTKAPAALPATTPTIGRPGKSAPAMASAGGAPASSSTCAGSCMQPTKRSRLISPERLSGHLLAPAADAGSAEWQHVLAPLQLHAARRVPGHARRHIPCVIPLLPKQQPAAAPCENTYPHMEVCSRPDSPPSAATPPGGWLGHWLTGWR